MKFNFSFSYLSAILYIIIVLFLSSCRSKDKTEVLIDQIKTSLKEKGCNIDSITIKQAEKCAVIARVYNGQIEICNRFFDYESRDQVSIIWHEAFHLNNDKAWSNISIILDQPIYIQNIPDTITYGNTPNR